MIQVLLTIRESDIVVPAKEPDADGRRRHATHRAVVQSNVLRVERPTDRERRLVKRLVLHGKRLVFDDQVEAGSSRTNVVSFDILKGREPRRRRHP